MNKILAGLLASKKAKADAARAILAAADANVEQPGKLTAEQQAAFDAAMAEIDVLDQRIGREQALATAEANLGAVTVLNPNAVGSISVAATPEAENDPRHGFANLAEFYRAVVVASVNPRAADTRLRFDAAAPSVSNNTQSGGDGDFLVPPQFSSDIWQSVRNSPASLVPLVDDVPIEGNSMAFPKDETTPWGADGVQAYWQAEAAAVAQSKARFGISQMRLHKLMCLVPLTDELRADAPAAAAHISNRMGSKIGWKASHSIMRGSGAGQPLGFMNGGGLVTVTKDAGHTYSATAALSVVDVFSMMSRMHPEAISEAMWLVHPSMLISLGQLKLGDTPVFQALSDGIREGFAGRLMGLPLRILSHCSAPLAVGDIVLAAPRAGYRTISKRGGIETATSMHLFFDAGVEAMRATFRIDGHPLLSAPVTPENGTDTLSHFVALDDTR